MKRKANFEYTRTKNQMCMQIVVVTVLMFNESVILVTDMFFEGFDSYETLQFFIRYEFIYFRVPYVCLTMIFIYFKSEQDIL